MPADSSKLSKSNARRIAICNFLIAVFLSGVPILAYLWLSVDMAYGSWAAVGTGQWIGVVSVPLFCGILSAAFGQQMIKILSVVVESAQLPF